MAAPAQINTLRATDFPKGLAAKGDVDKLFSILNPFLQQAGAVTSKGTALQQNIDGQFATFDVTGNGVTDWTALTLTAPWVATASYATPAYRVSADGLVALRGNVNAGTILQPITTLPAAVRPAALIDLAAQSTTSTGPTTGTNQLRIGTNGVVTPFTNGGGGTFNGLSLDQVSWYVAAPKFPAQLVRLKDGKKPRLVVAWAQEKGGGSVVATSNAGWTYLGQSQVGNQLRVDDVPGLVAGIQYTVNVFVFF